jgi:hypothetical protein
MANAPGAIAPERERTMPEKAKLGFMFVLHSCGRILHSEAKDMQSCLRVADDQTIRLLISSPTPVGAFL